MKQRILGIPPHFSLILSLMLLTFSVTDHYNTAMAFINHPMTKTLIAVLVAFNLLTAVRFAFLREAGTRAVRMIASLTMVVLSFTGTTLLCIDEFYPDRALFTTEGAKTMLAVLAVLSIIFSILLIVLQRKEASTTIREEAHV
jgi:hypothetical protein